jgi:hypothetical protein
MHHLLESLAVMMTVQQRVDCMLWPLQLKSITCSQLKFQLLHTGLTPSYNSTKKWDRCLRETRIAVNQKLPRHPRISNEDQKYIRQAFLCSLRKLLRTSCGQLYSSHYTFHNIAHEHLHSHAYNL